MEETLYCITKLIPLELALVQDDDRTIEDIDTGKITQAKIMAVIKVMKSGKAVGTDSITIRLLKASAAVLEDLVSSIREDEKIPDDWKRGLIVKGDLTLCDN